MNELSINLKIEAKKIILPYLNYNSRVKLNLNLNSIYIAFNKDIFLLKYRVQKLSKKAKKNTINLKTI